MLSRAGRGDRREPIYLDDVDRQDFLKTLAEACQKTGWQVHAFCLMPNHFHLVIETPQANLVAGMRWLLSAYSIRFNHRHRLVGRMFSGRYKALLADGSGDGYLRTACDYVRRLGWKEAHLAARRKGDPAKLAMAARLRKETTLSIKEIAARMHLGTSQSANTRLHEWMKKTTKARPTGQRKERPGK